MSTGATSTEQVEQAGLRSRLEAWAGSDWQGKDTGGGCWVLELSERVEIADRGRCFLWVSLSEDGGAFADLGAYLDDESGDTMVAWVEGVSIESDSIERVVAEVLAGKRNL